jgi:hypothetical protein
VARQRIVEALSTNFMLLFLFLLFVIIFMQGIENYIPETNNISRISSVAAIL